MSARSSDYVIDQPPVSGIMSSPILSCLPHPFGFGPWSYADFWLPGISRSHVRPYRARRHRRTVSVEVTNTGYGGECRRDRPALHGATVSLPVRPVEELKDFTRITLNPGETRTVTFALTPDKLEVICKCAGPSRPVISRFSSGVRRPRCKRRPCTWTSPGWRQFLPAAT